ncbi:MAG TPA: NAD(P)H-dependent oxidoreductase [Thermoanaerobaculia bacterium]|nr:NAD(P)H-dependent oxidoreductase [Thermoanaerobaculia bacterium]
MRIVAISGSLRTSSSTAAVVRLAADVAPEVELVLYDALGELPHFSPDLDHDAPPSSVATLRQMLSDADALLICTPEYAHGMPGSLKNLLDRLVSWTGFAGMRVAALSASPSADGGKYALQWLVQTLTMMSAEIVTTLTVPYVKNRLATNDEVLRNELREAVRALSGS